MLQIPSEGEKPFGEFLWLDVSKMRAIRQKGGYLVSSLTGNPVLPEELVREIASYLSGDDLAIPRRLNKYHDRVHREGSLHEFAVQVLNGEASHGDSPFWSQDFRRKFGKTLVHPHHMVDFIMQEFPAEHAVNSEEYMDDFLFANRILVFLVDVLSQTEQLGWVGAQNYQTYLNAFTRAARRVYSPIADVTMKLLKEKYNAILLACILSDEAHPLSLIDRTKEAMQLAFFLSSFDW